MKTVGHWKQLQTTWCDPQTIVSKCWVTSKTYHYVLFFVGHYCFQVPHAPALSGTRKTNTFKIVEMTNFSTVYIGKINTIFRDMWALSSCNRRSWRWQQIAWRLRKCSLLNVNAFHKNKEKNTFDFYMENHLAPQHTFGCLSHQILAVALGFYSIYCNNFRWEGEDDFEKSKHIWKKGNMSWNQLGLGGRVGGGGGWDYSAGHFKGERNMSLTE